MEARTRKRGSYLSPYNCKHIGIKDVGKAEVEKNTGQQSDRQQRIISRS